MHVMSEITDRYLTSRSCLKMLSVWSVVNSSHILSRTVFFLTYRLLFTRSSLILVAAADRGEVTLLFYYKNRTQGKKRIKVEHKKAQKHVYWICPLPSTPWTWHSHWQAVPCLRFPWSGLSWIAIFITGCTQRVRVGGQYSTYSAVHYGVPQGSVLGPILFLLYTADVLHVTV